jgi:hypothetical protein
MTVVVCNGHDLVAGNLAVMNDSLKRRGVKEIKPQGDTRFNVGNPLDTRGKNHGRQPASNFTMIGVRLQTPTAVAYK